MGVVKAWKTTALLTIDIREYNQPKYYPEDDTLEGSVFVVAKMTQGEEKRSITFTQREIDRGDLAGLMEDIGVCFDDFKRELVE